MEFDLSFLRKRRTVGEVWDTVKDLNPDDVAKAWELEKQGVPADVGMVDPVGIDRVRSAASEAFGMEDEAPITAEFLRDARRMAVAHDSLRELREMEKAMHYAYPLSWGEAISGGLDEMGKSIARSFPSSVLGYARGLRHSIRESLREDGYADDEIQGYLEGGGELRDAPVDGALDLPGMARNTFMRMGLHRALYRGAGDVEEHMLTRSALAKPEYAPDDDFQARLRDAGGMREFLSDTVGGVAMLGEIMAFSFIGGPLGGAMAILSNITGMEYEQNLEAGVDPTRAYNAAFLSAVAQWPLEATSLNRALAVWSPKTILAQRFKALVHHVATEGVTEYSQSYIEELARLFATQADARTIAEVRGFWESVFSAEFQAQAGYQGLVGAASAGVTGGGGMLKGVAEQIRANKFAKRAPTEFEKMLGRFVENGSWPETLYVPAGEVQMLFQGATPGEVERFLDMVEVSPAEFREALEAEGEIAIPGKKLGRVVMDERGQALRDKLAVSPLEFEAQRQAREQARDGQAEGGAVVGIDPEERVRLEQLFQQPLESASKEREEFKRRLIEDGGFRDEQADQYAALVDAQAHIWADVMGLPIGDYYKTYGWEVRRSRAEDFTGGQALFQAAKKVVYNDTRALKVTYEATDEDISLDDREQLGKYFESLDAAKIKGLKLDDYDGYVQALAKIVEDLFPDFTFRMTKDGKEMDLDHFLTQKKRQVYIDTLPTTLKDYDVKVELSKDDGVKALFIKRYFDEEVAADIWDIAVAFNDQVQTKFPTRGPKGRREVVRATEQDINRAGMRAPSPANPPGETGAAPSQARYGESIDHPEDGVHGPDVLKQGAGDEPRGATLFKDDGQAIIHFFQAKDLSTAPHEIMHVFRRVLEDMALHPDAPAMVRDDWAKACGFVGAEPGQPWTVEQEEKWAAAGEAYLMEGRAPSVELQGAFQTFRKWLLAIYRHVSTLGVRLSDEMRGVFDRMLASEEQAERAKDVAMIRAFFDEGEAGDIYFDQVRKAEVAAEEAVQARREMEYRKMLSQWRRQAKEASAEHPVLRRVAALVDGDEDALGDLGGKGLDYKMLLEHRGEDDTRLLLGRRPGLVRRDGLNPFVAAEALGYTDLDTMLDDILAAPTKREYEESLVAQSQADWERQWRADEEVLTESFERMLELEAEILADSAAGRTVSAETLRKYVEERTGSARVGQLVGDFSALRAAYMREAKAAQRQRKASGTRARNKALKHKERQRRALAELREKYRAKEEVGKALRYFSRVQKSKTIDPEYKEQIDAILGRFDLRKSVTNKAIKRKNNLADFILAREEAGEVVNIPERLRDEAFRVHYKELSLEQLREVKDAVRNVEQLGRLKHKLLTNKKYRERKAAVKAITDSIYSARKTRKDAGKLELNPSIARKLTGKLERYHAQLTKPEFLFHGLDGWEFGGPVWELLFKPIADAESAELALWEEKGAEFQAALERIPAAKRAMWRMRKKFVPEIGQSLTREQMIAVALNSGNEGNLAALRGGYGWDDAQIQAVKDHLDKDEWAVVQDVWRIIDSLWPRIEELHKTMAGYAPPKIEAVPVQTKFGVIEGGYYPLQFDRKLSWSARRISEEEAGKEMFENIYRRPTTRSGFTKERTGGKLPVRLSLDVAAKHLSDVIHHVTHAPAVRDVNLLIQQDEVREAIEAVAGREMYAILRPWLQHVARPEREYINAWEGIVGHARQGATVVSLGWKFSVAAKQFLSFTQTIDEIGTVDSMAGLARFFANPWEATAFANERSAGIRNRRKQYDREVRDAMKRFSPSGWTSMMKESFFYLIGLMDAVATYPSWLGAYRRGMRQFQGDEARAVDYADHVVRTTQPAASPKDLAQVQRGTEFWKIFTSFYTFFSVFYGRASMRAGQARARGVKGLPQAMASFMLLYAIPSALSYIISERRVPDMGDEEDRKELLKAMASYGIATVPVARDVMSAILTKFDYTMSPTQGAFDSVARMVKTMTKDEVDEWQAFKRSVEVAGYWGHLPSRQIIITTEGIIDLSSGRTDDWNRLLFPEKR